MVASYRVVPYLQHCHACMGSYAQCCTQLLKVLHKCCNTDVLGVLLIYRPTHSPSDAVRPRSRTYISVKPLATVIQYIIAVLSVKDYPTAMKFNQDTMRGFITTSLVACRKSILSYLQV